MDEPTFICLSMQYLLSLYIPLLLLLHKLIVISWLAVKGLRVPVIPYIQCAVRLLNVQCCRAVTMNTKNHFFIHFEYIKEFHYLYMH